jgi:hypothetical protein
MKTFLLTLWMLSTLILTCTVVGMLLFVPSLYYYGNKSTWMKIGMDLTESINDKHSWYFFILWLFFTIILTCTVIGMLLFIPDGRENSSSWMEIGHDIVHSVRKK